jgi:hypothetical protein
MRAYQAKRECHAHSEACGKVLKNARAGRGVSSVITYIVVQPLILYKKQPVASRPCATWPPDSFAHLIHSQAHNLWGQLKFVRAPAYAGCGESLGVFFLTPQRLSAVASLSNLRVWTGMRSQSQRLRCLRDSFQWLHTDLSTGRGGIKPV